LFFTKFSGLNTSPSLILIKKVLSIIPTALTKRELHEVKPLVNKGTEKLSIAILATIAKK
jgi:hypothetical protein